MSEKTVSEKARIKPATRVEFEAQMPAAGATETPEHNRQAGWRDGDEVDG